MYPRERNLNAKLNTISYYSMTYVHLHSLHSRFPQHLRLPQNETLVESVSHSLIHSVDIYMYMCMLYAMVYIFICSFLYFFAIFL